MKKNSYVYAKNVENTGIKDAIRILTRRMEGDFRISDGDKVCIKPNICLLKKPNTGITTNPLVVQAIIESIQNRYDCDISIVESDATINNADVAFDALGWKKLASDLDVNLINLTKDEKVRVDFKGYSLNNPKIPRTLYECDFLISVPKLKAHEITGITGALKNQFGCLPERKKVKYHRRINETIVDAATLFKPNLSVMDAIITPKGGAITGIPFRSNLILASIDPVAIDAVCAKYVGINPMKIKHLQLAEKAGLGSRNYVLQGDVTELKPLYLSSRSFIDRITSLFIRMTSRGV